jgi:hypothetical protein
LIRLHIAVAAAVLLLLLAIELLPGRPPHARPVTVRADHGLELTLGRLVR